VYCVRDRAGPALAFDGARRPTRLVAQIFGVATSRCSRASSFFSHQIGSFLGAWLGGKLYDTTGSYDIVWYLPIALGIAAGLINLPHRRARDQASAVQPHKSANAGSDPGDVSQGCSQPHCVNMFTTSRAIDADTAPQGVPAMTDIVIVGALRTALASSAAALAKMPRARARRHRHPRLLAQAA
jgi:hypothetical protein